MKVSKKGSQYFSFELQQKKRVVKAVCFSPKKHKSAVDKQEESGLPCKISRFTPHTSEDNVIWVNHNSQITDALETAVEYSQNKNARQEREIPQLCSTKELDDIEIHQSVSVRGFLLFGDQQPVPIPTKKELVKREGRLIDESGIFPVTIWNDAIKLVAEGGFFEIQSIHLRQYQGQRYLSSALETVFNKISNEAPTTIPKESIAAALVHLNDKEITCHNITSVMIQNFYTCVNCSKKVMYQQDTEILKCNNCHARFLKGNSNKTTVANLDIKKDGESTKYALFTPVLKAILDKYNSDNGKSEELEKLDDDILSSIILLSKGLTLKVNNNGNVVGVNI